MALIDQPWGVRSVIYLCLRAVLCEVTAGPKQVLYVDIYKMSDLGPVPSLGALAGNWLVLKGSLALRLQGERDQSLGI